jgi:hypothetical protein
MKNKRSIKFVFLGLLLLLFTGCNRLSFVLYWADTLVISSLNDYFDLTSSEEKKLKVEIQRLITEIKSNEFKQTIDLLNKIKSDVKADSVDVAKIESYEIEFDKIAESIGKKTKPIFIDRIQKQKIKGFEKFDKEFEARIKKSQKRFEKSKTYDQDLKSLDRWVDNSLGFLTPSQQLWLKKEIKDNPSPQLLRIQSRQHVFENFKSVRSDNLKLELFLNQYFDNWESQQSADYILARNKYRSQLRVWIVRLLSDKNANQKDNLIKTIDKLTKELHMPL